MKAFIIICLVLFIFCEKIPRSQKKCLVEKLGKKKAKTMVRAYYYYIISGKKTAFSDYVSLKELQL